MPPVTVREEEMGLNLEDRLQLDGRRGRMINGGRRWGARNENATIVTRASTVMLQAIVRAISSWRLASMILEVYAKLFYCAESREFVLILNN